MIYLTNDTLDQAVYFDVIRQESQRKRGGAEQLVYGLLGNGISEVAVTVRRRFDQVEMVFGRGEIFSFVEETIIRRMLGDAVREMVLQ